MVQHCYHVQFVLAYPLLSTVCLVSRSQAAINQVIDRDGLMEQPDSPVSIAAANAADALSQAVETFSISSDGLEAMTVRFV